MNEMVEMSTIKDIKVGEFFKLKADAKRVYIRGEYDRSEKKYCCVAFDDVNMCRMFAGNKTVFVGFTF